MVKRSMKKTKNVEMCREITKEVDEYLLNKSKNFQNMEKNR